jgi:hypothetical protein
MWQFGVSSASTKSKYRDAWSATKTPWPAPPRDGLGLAQLFEDSVRDDLATGRLLR